MPGGKRKKKSVTRFMLWVKLSKIVEPRLKWLSFFLPNGSDQGCDDLIAKDGIGKFKELKRIKLRHDGLAQFKPWWENWRKTKNQEAKDFARIASRMQPVELWPDPVDGIALIEEIHAQLKRFITVQSEALVVQSLWTLFAHAIDAFGIAPILHFLVPRPRVRKVGRPIHCFEGMS